MEPPAGSTIDKQNSLALALLPSLSVQGLPSFSLSQLLSDENIHNALEAAEWGDALNEAGATNGDGAAPAAIPQLLRRLSANLLQGTACELGRGL